MDERGALLDLISDLSKDARGFRDRNNYSDLTIAELQAIADDYYRQSLEEQYMDACDLHGIPFTLQQINRMNIAELEHRLANMP
jgi:hypothetical protein